MIPGSPLLFLRSKYPQSKNKKATSPGSLACGLRNFLIKLQLSPETPLARDGRHATRSVARAETTHRLATVPHESEEYSRGIPVVKGMHPTKIRCIASKKVINDCSKFIEAFSLPELLPSPPRAWPGPPLRRLQPASRT